MRRPALRALMVVVGLSTLAVYLLARTLWRLRPDPATLALGLFAHTLARIERATEPPWERFTPLYVSGDEEGPLRLVSTHPDTERRVEPLREMADRTHHSRRRRRIS